MKKLTISTILTLFFYNISATAVVTGASNLMTYCNLEHAYNKFCGRKMKEQLSAFLPNLPGNIDGPGNLDNRLKI